MSADQVAALAKAAERNRAVVLVLAYCGLRFGEAAALRVADLDLLRCRIRVERSVTDVGRNRKQSRLPPRNLLVARGGRRRPQPGLLTLRSSTPAAAAGVSSGLARVVRARCEPREDGVDDAGAEVAV
ncbi:MAG TPA: tyrosine-type recombinase/integrase [Micromonosporaceae bacterium]